MGSVIKSFTESAIVSVMQSWDQPWGSAMESDMGLVMKSVIGSA